jgi:hypothetical protein
MRIFSRKSAAVLKVCIIRQQKEIINTVRGKINCFLLLEYVVVSGLSTDVKMNRLASSQKYTVGLQEERLFYTEDVTVRYILN